MVHLYGVFIDCLMLVTFYRGSLSFCPVGWDCKILVIVGTLFEQQWLFVASWRVIVDHSGWWSERSWCDVSVNEYVIPGNRRHVECEMGEYIVSLCVGVFRVGASHKKSSMLGLVVEIALITARSVSVKHGVVYRRIMNHPLYSCAGIVDRGYVEPSVLIACWEYELSHMLVDYIHSKDALRCCYYRLIIMTSVLCYHHFYVVEWVLYIHMPCI